MRVRYTQQALLDLNRVFSYINQYNPQAAKQTISRIKKAIDQLPDHPYLGRGGQVADTRELVVSSIPYTVAYRLTANHIDILAIIHQAQQWPEQF